MVQCTNFKSHKVGNLLGFADIFVEKWGIHIYGCSMFHKEGRSWISLPAKEYKDENGEKKYAPVIRFESKDHQGMFSKQCLYEINRFVNEKQEPQEIPEF